MLILAASVALVPAVAAGATSNSKPTSIGGIITDHNKPVRNRAVSLDCSSRGHTKFLGNTRTDADGRYTMRSNAQLCPAGSQLVAHADKNGNGKFEPNEIGISIIVSNSFNSIINITINVQNTVVPEFGPVAAVAAVAIASGGLLLIRRHGLSPRSQSAAS